MKQLRKDNIKNLDRIVRYFQMNKFQCSLSALSKKTKKPE